MVLFIFEVVLGKASNKKSDKLGLLAQPPLTPTYLPNLGPLNRYKGGKIFFIALFHVLDYLDQFKAIKENLLRGVGHPDPLRTPTYLRLSQKPKFVAFFFWKPSLSGY